MTHIANKQIQFAQEIALLSESNLAVVEQTNASMHSVNDTINKLQKPCSNYQMLRKN